MKTFQFVFFLLCTAFTLSLSAQRIQIEPKVVKPTVIDLNKIKYNTTRPQLVLLPDLIITSFTAGAAQPNPHAANSLEDYRIPFQMTIKNIGGSRAGRFVVKVQKDYVCPPGMDSYFCYEIRRTGPHRVKMIYGGLKINQLYASGLNAGRTITFTGYMLSSGPDANGQDNWRYRATVDANSQVRESKENNNRKTATRTAN